ncbi:GNAT family N-acetyltransferase [Legionella oakridgensis]|uniref:Acetyltransferase n=2 Tax=Legionella oakridgensis TaxID=29423 RepID=W0BEN5_9GAMM|nr:GNAT family N-acetyltransferase [Legionella oakridgensis]AHE66869.1 acetyltransferase [Legionella oakridgensis ATCC 33761 = DSM 21215]ETO93442.1 acetyltransferase [Legionella oakridgensis RV-2-2007]KTD39760.1 N-acetyltransferase ats1 [Legionella oakridgensis]STY19980.1 N-acetyltransferase ats1 [Legionella longbeachae]
MTGYKELFIRTVKQSDFSDWKILYKKYLIFYKTNLTETELVKLWTWFFEPQKQIYCFIAIVQNKPIGLIHFREYLRPIKATNGMFIDDLYVDNAFRGQGTARALIKAVREFCVNKKINSVRWITAQDNHDAMKLYDQLAIQTPWRMYEMPIQDEV